MVHSFKAQGHRSHGTWVYSTGNRAHPIGQGSYVTWGMPNGAGHSKIGHMTRVHKFKGIRQRGIGYRDIYGTAAT